MGSWRFMGANMIINFAVGHIKKTCAKCTSDLAGMHKFLCVCIYIHINMYIYIYICNLEYIYIYV